MQKKLLIVVLSALFALCCQGKHIIGYYPAWATYGRNYQVAEIPAQYLTHIFYAFANINNGECVLGDPYADVEKSFPGDNWEQPIKGNFNQLIQLKQKHPHIKTLISVGGWTWSKYFSDVALTADSRAKFVTSCVNFMKQYSFDGIDIDWEYPVEGGLPDNIYRPEDGTNHALLMAKFREELDKLSEQHYLLTIAAPAGASKYRHLILPELAKSLDFINLMTYDYQGGWSTVTGHQAAVYFNSSDPSASEGLYAHKGMSDFVAGGMPVEKMLIGGAIYGRGWKEVPSSLNGLFQTFNGVPKGTWDDYTSGDTGIFDYDDIKKNKIGKGYSTYYDSEAQGAWVYSPTEKIMISYDSPQVILDKVQYVNEYNYGGIFFWDLSGDREGELYKIMYDNLNQ